MFQKIFVDRLLGIDDTGIFGWLAILPIPLLLVGAFFAAALAAACSLAAMWLGTKESIIAQDQIAHQIYAKTLRMRPDQLGGRTVGEVVSLYAVDVPGSTAILDQTLPMSAGIIFPLLIAPIAIRWISDVPVWATTLLTLAIVFLNGILSWRQARFFTRFKQLAAERTGLVSEWVQNMRLLRILGWTESYEKKIHKKRVEETANRVAMVTNGQMMGSIGSTISFFINLCGVASVVFLRGGSVTPGELLALLWIFGVFLSRPFRQVPWMFTWFLDALTSLRRVEKYLAERDLDDSTVEIRGAPEAQEGGRAAALRVRGLSLGIHDRVLLSNISFDIQPGEFVAIVGEVGSGKSLLALSLMGETGARFDSFEIAERDARKMSEEERRAAFSYVPQEGFVMSATLRENVVLEYGVGREWDASVVASLGRAQFDLTRESIQAGLETEIGERGVNLSGGQKQRVSLARADHNIRPILMLDDCLSAVDIETERNLIDKLFAGAWREHTRLLVTHRLSVLEHTDRVLFIEDGRLEAQGPLEELMSGNAKFRKFAATIALQDETSGLHPAGATRVDH